MTPHLIKRRAFTLVELLVVIAIIGLLSSIAVVSLNSSRINSRDTKRIADLRQIRLALSMYYNENGFYPPSPCGYDCHGYYSSYDANWNTSVFAVALSPYLTPLPRDPINSSCMPWDVGNCFSYVYGNVGNTTYPKTYDLSTRLENPSNPLRCGIQNYHWGLGGGFGSVPWCVTFGGAYTDQMYEIAPSD
jgi:prepilin-type N-terminal cleavage/methylation domain-containing protein